MSERKKHMPELMVFPTEESYLLAPIYGHETIPREYVEKAKVAEVSDRDTAIRIVACVNACKGIEDPAAVIKDLIEVAKAFRAHMKDQNAGLRVAAIDGVLARAEGHKP